MKRLMSIACLCAIAVPALCRDGADTAARKKLLQRIDSWLAQAAIQRADIERAIKGLEKASEDLFDARVKAVVRAERLRKEVDLNKKKVEDSKIALAKLQADLEKMKADPTYTVTYGGKTYTKPEELALLLDKLSDYHKKLLEQTVTQEKVLADSLRTVAVLTQHSDEVKKRFAEIRDHVKTLDKRIALIQATNDDVKALTDDDKDFAEKIKAIEAKLKELEKSDGP